MSTEDNLIENKVENSPKTPQPSVFDEILKEREEIKDENKSLEKSTEKPSENTKKETTDKKEIKDEKKEEEKEDPKNTEKSVKKETVKKEDEKDEDDERETEIANLRKSLNDSQRWGHNNNRRLKNTLKAINALKESGTLNEEEFNEISNLLASDSEEPEIESQETSNDPLQNYIRIADSRITDLQEIYDEDPLFTKKIEGFNFFMRHCTPQEREDLIDDLDSIGKNPLKLAKHMYKVGEKYYEENYKELDEAGGLKELLTVKNDEIKRLQRKVDKLERKALESNDYDKPTQRIDELTDVKDESVSEDKPGDVLGSIISRRDRKQGR